MRWAGLEPLSRTLLDKARGKTYDVGKGAALSLQHDFSNPPWQVTRVHGVLSALYGSGTYELSRAFAAAHLQEREENRSDRRRPFGPRGAPNTALAEGIFHADQNFPFATVQPRAEP